MGWTLWGQLLTCRSGLGAVEVNVANPSRVIKMNKGDTMIHVYVTHLLGTYQIHGL
jgi:hypothetical protein